MYIVDKNYVALFDHGIKMLVTYQLYILDPRFVPRLYSDYNQEESQANMSGFHVCECNIKYLLASYLDGVPEMVHQAPAGARETR